MEQAETPLDHSNLAIIVSVAIENPARIYHQKSNLTEMTIVVLNKNNKCTETAYKAILSQS